MLDDTCCIEIHDGDSTCGSEVPADSPLKLCRNHLIKAYIYIKGELAHVQQKTVIPGMRPVSEVDDRRSVVYYIRFSDRVKIGTTMQLGVRLATLPHDEILAVEPGGLQVERSRQLQFIDHRVRGEWFRAVPPLLDHARLIKGLHPDLMDMAAAL